MPVTEIQLAVDMVVSGRGRKILLTGTCWYELTGLWHLLSAQGYNVYRVPQGYSCVRESWDLVIVALSTESVAGWGRHLSWIRELRARISGNMLVLVPERLKHLKVLRNTSLVYSGCESRQELKNHISAVIFRNSLPSGCFCLTDGQSRALKRFSERGRDRPLELAVEERGLYWHYARLAKNVGVRDFRLLLLSGLDREINEMESEIYGK